jgi:ribosomal protein S18 acetylase RimI-like enzyme
MKFRQAIFDDLEQLKVLEQKVIDAERPFNSLIKNEGAYYYDIDQLISSDQCCLLVAEVGKELVATGYAKIRRSKPSLNHEVDSYLGFMYVLPEFRGQGVNRQILNQLLDWSREQGARDLYLDVYSDNIAAINAYKKAGFSTSMIEMKLSI